MALPAREGFFVVHAENTPIRAGFIDILLIFW